MAAEPGILALCPTVSAESSDFVTVRVCPTATGRRAALPVRLKTELYFILLNSSDLCELGLM